MVATAIVNQRYDEASKELREVLGQLEGLDGSLGWIDNISRPSGDGPIPHDEVAMRGYAQEINLVLAKALTQQQARIAALERKLEKRSSKKS